MLIGACNLMLCPIHVQRAKDSKSRRKKKTGGGGLEESQMEAQQQASLLRAVVAPMEGEIIELKKQLVKARTTMNRTESNALFETVRKTEAGKALEQEKRSRADLELQLHMQKTQNHVLVGDLENLKIAIEREKGFASEAKMNASRAAEHFFESMAKQEARATQLEKKLKEQRKTLKGIAAAAVVSGAAAESPSPAAAKSPGPRPLTQITADIGGVVDQTARNSPTTAGPDGGLEDGAVVPPVVPLSDNERHLEARVAELTALATDLEQQLQDEQGSNHDRFSELDRLGDLLKEERHEDRIRATEQWTLQRRQYESEMKTLNIHVDSSKKRIETLQATVGELNESVLQPCEYCADYEYKVVSMQEQVKQAATDVREVEKECDVAVSLVQTKVDVQAKQHAGHVAASLNQQEARLKAQFESQYQSLDLQSAANVAVILEALNTMESSSAALLQRTAELTSASDAQGKAYAKQVSDLKAKLSRAEQQLLSIQQEGVKTGVTMQDLQITIEAHELASAQNVAVMDALQQELKQTGANPRTASPSPLGATGRPTTPQGLETTKLAPTTPQTPGDLDLLQVPVGLSPFAATTPPAIVPSPSDPVTKDGMQKLRKSNKKLKKDFALVLHTNTNLIAMARGLSFEADRANKVPHEATKIELSTVLNCMQCREEFTGMRTKTTCRHCGNAFCWDCAWKIVTQGQATARVCERCYSALSTGTTVLRLSDDEQRIAAEDGRPRSNTTGSVQTVKSS